MLWIPHWIRIHHAYLGPVPGPNPEPGLWWPMTIHSWGKNPFLSTNTFYFIPRSPWRASKLHEKPSALKREHPWLHNLLFLHKFLFLCVIFSLLDLDPIPADHNQGGSTTRSAISPPDCDGKFTLNLVAYIRSGHGFGLRALMTIHSWGKILFLSTNTIFLSLGFHEGRLSQYIFSRRLFECPLTV